MPADKEFTFELTPELSLAMNLRFAAENKRLQAELAQARAENERLRVALQAGLAELDRLCGVLLPHYEGKVAEPDADALAQMRSALGQA